MTTLQHLASEALGRHPDYPAVEWEKQEYSWGDLNRVAEQVIGLLEQTGATPDAPVALLPANRPGLTGALIGLLAIGRNIRMVHVYQSDEGIANAVRQLRPAVAIGMADKFSPVLVDALRNEGIAAISIDGLEARLVAGAEKSTIACERSPKLQIQLLTSGTTGPPKQFALDYDLIARDMVAVNSMSVTGDVQARSLPPLYFYLNCGTITGLYLQIPVLLNGRRGFLVDRFSVPTFHDFVRRHSPVSMGLPMPAIQMILDANIPPADMASLQCIQTGAAPIDPKVHRAFEERYGIVLQLVYGATEFGGPVAMMTMDLHRDWGERKFGSQGRAFNGAELRVVDPDTGSELPRGETGVLEVRTSRIGPDWIRTSDLFTIDEDEFLWFRGRIDGAINRGGFKIQPEIIEAALRLHPAVAFASVVGLPDRRLGQVPVAAIQVHDGAARPGPEELIDHLRRHVETTYIPAHWRFVEAMPYTTTMKVDQAAVRRLFEETEVAA